MHHRPLRLAAAATACALTATAGAAEITRGPVLSQPTTDGVVVTFELDAPAMPTIRWGTGGTLDNTWTAEGSGDAFEVALTGLPTGAIVDYAVFVDDVQLHDTATIPTAVEPGTPFSFIIFGDTRSRPDVHAAIVAQMDAVPDVRWYVQTGDLVSDGEILDQWDEFFAIERPMTDDTPIFPTIGNHDEHDGDATNYVNVFANPENSPQPEHYYSFDYGNVHAVVLDGHVNAMTWLECFPVRGILLDDCFTEEQEQWLLADVEAAATDPDIDHIVVISHIGPYSSKDGRSGSAQMRLLLPRLHELGVTLIVSGHDHYYERGVSGNGIPYVITGGGGAPLYDVADPSSAPHEVVTNESVEHWMEIDVDGVTMTVTTRSLDGRTIDAFTIDATEECTTSDDCASVAPELPCETFEPRCSTGGRCIAECFDDGDGDAEDGGVDAGDPGDDLAADTGSDDTTGGEGTDTAAPDADRTDTADPDAGAGGASSEDTGSESPRTGSRQSGGCATASVSAGSVWLALVGFAVAWRRRTRWSA